MGAQNCPNGHEPAAGPLPRWFCALKEAGHSRTCLGRSTPAPAIRLKREKASPSEAAYWFLRRQPAASTLGQDWAVARRQINNYPHPSRWQGPALLPKGARRGAKRKRTPHGLTGLLRALAVLSGSEGEVKSPRADFYTTAPRHALRAYQTDRRSPRKESRMLLSSPQPWRRLLAPPWSGAAAGRR
jgi:hypothetical protein